MKNLLVVIAGPTAVGKTDISIELATHYKSEIISADSRQFYREMKIGTAIPGEKQLKQIQHHFIHHLSVTDYYNVYRYELDVLQKLDELFKKYSIIFLVGGSGLYIDAVCQGIDLMPDYDEEIRKTLNEKLKNFGLESLVEELKAIDYEFSATSDLKNPARILRALEVFAITGKPYSSFRNRNTQKRNFDVQYIFLNTERQSLYEKINLRVDKMISEGLLAEAEQLLPLKNYTALKTVGYRELFDFFENKVSYDEAITLIKRNTRRYAKKQITWFKRYENATWFSKEEIEKMITLIELKTK